LGFGISGVDQGDGAITLILAAIAGGLIAFARDRKVAPVMGVLCGLGITGVALYHVIDTAQTKVFGASMIGIIGAGLWITLVAGIVLTGAAGYGLHGVTRIDQPRSET
jgi:tellurite resistance protein TehA-like permease